MKLIPFLSCLALVVFSLPAEAAITDFSTWTEVLDPPDPNFSSLQQSNAITLMAGAGAIGDGVDIGYQSVNGQKVASSSQGHFFDPGSDFSIAVDYNWTFNSASGFLGLGFGIGEDRDGADGAGVAMLTENGLPFLSFAGAARVNDVDQTPIALGGLTPSSLSGSLFIDYNAASGDVTVGASTVAGAAAPTLTGTYAGIQNQWDDEGLLASFFIRSDGLFPGESWGGGNANAVFSNFRVISGTPVAIPEPTCGTILMALSAGLVLRRRRGYARLG